MDGVGGLLVLEQTHHALQIIHFVRQILDHNLRTADFEQMRHELGCGVQNFILRLLPDILYHEVQQCLQMWVQQVRLLLVPIKNISKPLHGQLMLV